MLSTLHIENMAVFTRADIEFGGGLNVLTGETGAGKSIVIDALGLVLGSRSDRGLLRSGEQKAVVGALFVQVPESVSQWMTDNGMDAICGGELLLQRELFADGKTTCRINGRPNTAAMLKALGQMLLSVHGQHDAYQLLRTESHRLLLDRYARHDAVIAAYTTAYESWSSLCRERGGLLLSENEKNERIEMLRYKLDDLERLDLQHNEEEALLSRRKMLRNASRLSDAALTCRALLCGDDDGDGVCRMLEQAAQVLASAPPVSGDWNAVIAKLEGLSAELSDATSEVLDLTDEISFSEDELDSIETRLELLTRAQQRHGVPVSELIARRDQYRDEINTLDYADMRLRELERAIAAAETELSQCAFSLTASRQNAADKLRVEIEQELCELDMASVTFRAAVVNNESYGPDGQNSIGFLISTNPGEPEKPLARIASGGELARIMLALQNVLIQADDISTLVFDEVDVGVSGRAAQRVAEKLAAVSRYKQVLCVTHLPQVAAFADTHFQISKSVADGRASTALQTLDTNGRIHELGRLLGAESAGVSALENARALLTEAERMKNNAVQTHS
jgi:DNA repair protein RecN (Recombination protein N)